jgi:protein tyrosine/serine phosphatase
VRETFRYVVSLEGQEENYKENDELAPVTVVSYPISAWEIYVKGISVGLLGLIIASIEALDKPVLVHCEHGEDRTGLIVAAYRVRVSGWDKSKAMAEALHFGYRKAINFGLNRTWDAFH